ncbi:MAG: bifunctional riboflavin kinase/FAD synthetase, partial [Verrucomicrobiales bacterium]|nr:bifunctional riboflavin kinase/FAD synthetase [Verrucomicrobiales bacterium]
DGLHLGHQAVIRAALDSAAEGEGEAVVITFDPHPVRVLSPQNAPRLLASLPHQIQILGGLGVKNLLVIEFDREFADREAEDFVRDLCRVPVARICVGENWKFGRGRRGNVELLEKLGAELEFAVSGIPILKIEGSAVSSTRIREAVAAGDFEVAQKLLGRPYTVLGTVIEGRKLGRTIGFPTANLTVHSEQLPPTGVYAVRATGSGDSWTGVANLGYRPTVEGGKTKRLLEVHLFGLEHDIYGEDIEVEFVKFLRPEKKFDGVDDLKKQIATDAEAAQAAFE